jgi:hypothetical protein
MNNFQKRNNLGGNKMNWKKDDEDSVPIERLLALERRIEELEARLIRGKELFLEEDLKARGLK